MQSLCIFVMRKRNKNLTMTTQTTTEKAANLISAVAAEQANYKGNTGSNKTNANQNGIEHGLWLAGQVMQTWFQDEVTPAIIEKVITAVSELQMSQTAPSFNEMIAAYNNGIRYGLFMALGMIKGAFAAELAPSIEVVKDWSNVPANERPEVVIDSQSTWAAMWPEFTPKFEKAA